MYHTRNKLLTTSRGLTVIEVDGTKSIDEVTTMVESHFQL
jgi:hypothetical protein